jgi:hypothetical protein
VVTIAPGAAIAYEPAEWEDALVVVERGELELEGRCGARRCFSRGDVLWLAGLPLLHLRNPGPEPTLIAAVSRRGFTTSPVKRPSEEIR